MSGFDIRYNNITGKWEVWEDCELYYDTETFEDAHRVYYNCVMIEPQFDDEEIEYGYEDENEPFIEIDLEGGRNDGEDINLCFISQVLQGDI